jgi:hypothetical protein
LYLFENAPYTTLQLFVNLHKTHLFGISQSNIYLFIYDVGDMILDYYSLIYDVGHMKMKLNINLLTMFVG